ncbi:MAG TPA: transglycosylase SLT domain-containing protein [Methylomirabilota bacterium]|nr:transglycosylase SLT domain-containing protein [Methylomirabilota bacterium]
MAIETRFVHVTATFLIIGLALAVVAPAGADPDLLNDIVEEAASPPAHDDFDPALVQRPTEEPGSLAVIPDAEAEVAIELEPWTEEVAEATQPLRPAYEVVVNDRVKYFMDRYTGDRREVVSRWFERSTRYLDMIREVFRARGLPEELAFVAMIESGYNPRAVSRAGAKGMWQFMAATARRYGLRVDQWVDERLDPVKSTTAAAAYLHDLHNLFGSWALAKAGYNAGEVKVARAIRLTGTSDFWALAESRYLRQETKNFVPAIHAATVIGRDPSRYGFEPSPSEAPVTTTVRVPPRTSLNTLSAKSGIPLDTLRALNPVLVRATTPPGRPYELTVPEDASERVLAAVAPRKPTTAVRSRKTGSGSTTGDIHVVQPNETIKSIAHHYGVSVANLLRWNSLPDPDRIRAGDRLRVAGTRVSAEPASAAR